MLLFFLTSRRMNLWNNLPRGTVDFHSGKVQPRASSGVVRIDPLRFLAGCRKKRLYHALSVLCLSLGYL